MKKRVYMDYNATTPVLPEVRDVLMDALDVFGNASSLHGFGREASALVEGARKAVARLIGAEPEEIVFTGGGSESNNSVLKMFSCGSSSCSCASLGRSSVVTSVIEHPSILSTARFLEHTGISVSYVSVDSYGRFDLDKLDELVTSDTALVSLMMANNEIGTLQDIKAAASIAHKKGALFHTDAVQAVGKVPVSVKELDVDYLSFSAHKIGGPKGVGVLYVRKGTPFCTFIHGGHQEHGKRAGTYNTQGIAGLGKACEIAQEKLGEESSRLWALREKLRQGIEENIKDVIVNGHPEYCLPGTLNVSFRGIEGEAILLGLDMMGVAVSTGSACASGSLDPSHVLLAIDSDPERAHGSIRFSLGWASTEEDVDYVLEVLPPVVERLRKISSVYSG
ncbi:IscS subfamily cysteine desulfurase [Spirochaetia bacterium 38H-sp]|uniref:cysteine desulfurase n=1 Tax=Rarispira pelagica TaxID=3141764 RepID=A0ABU9UBS9_9SPIR